MRGHRYLSAIELGLTGVLTLGACGDAPTAPPELRSIRTDPVGAAAGATRAERAAPAAPGRTKPDRSGFLPGAGGVPLFFRVLGHGADTALVLHGGPGLSMSHLVPELDRMADGRTLIFFDQRGGGYSPLPNPEPGMLALELFVADVEAVRQYFGMEQVTLIGHSWGAILAGLYTAAHPDRVARLVLLDPGPVAPAYFVDFATALSARLTEEDVARYNALLAQVADGPDPFGSCEAALTLLFSHYQYDPAGLPRMEGRWCGGSLAGIRQGRFLTRNVVLAAVADLDLRPLLATALSGNAVPALIVYGDAEPVPLASARAWAAAIPGARLVVLPQAGHFPWLETDAVRKQFFKVNKAFLRHTFAALMRTRRGAGE